MDELDYLSKRPDSFCQEEHLQFRAMAAKLHPSDIKDFASPTSCHQAAVIRDFSKLEQVGKGHALNICGGAIPAGAGVPFMGH